MRFYHVMMQNTQTSTPHAHEWTREDINMAAENEFYDSSQSRHEFLGISEIETEDGDIVPERELTQEEDFQASIEKLEDDGRIFICIENDDSPENDFEFLEDADRSETGAHQFSGAFIEACKLIVRKTTHKEVFDYIVKHYTLIQLGVDINECNMLGEVGDDEEH